MPATASPLSVTRIPDPEEPVPRVAWPTLGLLVVGLALWGGSTAIALGHRWPWWISTVVNAVASYLLFTVAHDAGHHSAASESRLNRWMGRLATPLFAPHASFPTWRFIHMQHHRFTNHDDGRDPDHYTMEGPAWQRPLRWLTIDFYYRYIAVWRRNEERYLAGKPALSTIRGRELTTDEYRRIRELVEHH
jgi:fatty acid desaturase